MSNKSVTFVVRGAQCIASLHMLEICYHTYSKWRAVVCRYCAERTGADIRLFCLRNGTRIIARCFLHMHFWQVKVVSLDTYIPFFLTLG